MKTKDNTMRCHFMSLAGALALASVSGQALAQATAPAANVPFVAQQPANEWLARVFIGQAVRNTAGEIVGDVNDLVFDRQGRISTVVIGVGGLLGMGEKYVAVSFASLAFNVASNGNRVIVVAVSKEALAKAPEFKATEKTTFEKVKDKAAELGKKTVDKAVDLKDQAAQKIEDMTKSGPAKQ
jgi:sporulation protein YlmC with PRC-barrel domain